MPGLCDSDENLEQVVRWTAPGGHGGRFAPAGGLTLADQQRDYSFGVLRDRFPDRLLPYERLYPAGSCAAVRRGDSHVIGRRMRDLCERHGIADPPDGVPRPIIPGDKRAHLRQAHGRGAGAQRPGLRHGAGQRPRPARVGLPQGCVGHEDLPALPVRPGEQDVGLVYRAMGRKGLESIGNAGPRPAEVVEDPLKEWADSSV
jgi:hypothetical protein